MKIRLFFVGLLLTATCGFAATCVPGSLQDYFGLDPAGCTAGAVTFRNFFAVPGQTFATVIDPATISVSPGGTLFQPNLVFGVNMTADAGQFLESFFQFEVSGPSLGGVSIAFGAGSFGFTDGAALTTADICPGGSFFPGEPEGCPNSKTTLIAFDIGSDSERLASATFTPTSFFDVFVDLTIDGGTSGTAFLDSATFEVTAVPEPVTISFVAAGLAALAVRRLRPRR